jgi:hypothetical protein
MCIDCFCALLKDWVIIELISGIGKTQIQQVKRLPHFFSTISLSKVVGQINLQSFAAFCILIHFFFFQILCEMYGFCWSLQGAISGLELQTRHSGAAML